MIVIGELALWLALLMAAWSAITAFAGIRSRRADLALSGERGLHAVAVLLPVAAAGLLTALLSRDFSLRHVAAYTSANLPTLYTVATLWLARPGALLLGAWFASLATLVSVFRHRRQHPRMTAFACGIVGLLVFVALAAVCFVDNPYARVDFPPPEGMGMNPRLQNAPTVFHALSLCVAWAIAAVAAAFLLTPALAKSMTAEPLRVSRVWTLAAWVLAVLTALLGMLAVYRESGGHATWWRVPVDDGSWIVWSAATGLLAWAFLRERNPKARMVSRLVMCLAVAGLASLLLGFVGVAFTVRHEVRVNAGETVLRRDPYGREWQFTSQGVSRSQGPNYEATAIALQSIRPAARAALITSEIRQYVDSRQVSTFEPITKPGIRSTLLQDIAVVVTDISEAEAATVRMTFVPLLVWVWTGGALWVVAGVVAIWTAGARLSSGP